MQIDFLTITEENVEKIKCRSDTDHREETQIGFMNQDKLPVGTGEAVFCAVQQ